MPACSSVHTLLAGFYNFTRAAVDTARPPPLSSLRMNRARPVFAALATGSTIRWGLRERVAVALAALVVGATVLLSLLLAQQARQSHLVLAADNVDALASQMARELSHGMDRFTREVQLQAGNPAFSDPAATPQSMRRALEQVQRVYPEFAYLSVVDVASATVVAATGGIFEGGSAQGRPIFHEGQKGLFVADVHDAVRLANLLPRPASGEPLRFLDVAAPILGPDGKAIRVLAAHLSWEWTRAMKDRTLAPVETARKVQLMLVDTGGRVVMPPDATVPVGKPFRDVVGASVSNRLAAWSDGNAYLRAEAPTFATGAFPGLGWRVVSRQPLEVAVSGAERLRTLFLAGGLALGLLSAAIGWLLAGRIVRPVSELARAAAELAPGTNLAPATGREPREVAQVREAFHRVTGDALAKTERLMGELDTIYEGAPVGLCVLGPDLRISRANAAWEEAFGKGGSASVATPPALLDGARKAFEMGTAWALEIESGEPGAERVWQTVLAPVRGPDGRPAAVSVVATEVTEIRRAERALRLADQRKTEFISMLAHELRNPLAPVVNAVEILKRNPTETQASRMRDLMHAQIGRMTRLIDDLLDVSRVNLGKVTLKVGDVSPPEVCDAAVESVRHAVEARRQELRLDVPADLPMMRGDKVRLEQVICNLLSNASKYGREGGFIALSARASNGQLRIVVEDDGRGIAPDFLPHVFELFAQDDVPLDRAEGGLGIGLALVKSLVEMHGGEVAAFSDGPGKGSRFVVQLPLWIGEARRPQARVDRVFP